MIKRRGRIARINKTLQKEPGGIAADYVAVDSANSTTVEDLPPPRNERVSREIRAQIRTRLR